MAGNLDYPKYKVAAVQAAPIVKNAPEWFDVEATLEKAIGLIEEAGGNGARLIVFPETWLPCYPSWCLDMTDRQTFNLIWANYLWHSIEVPGRETEALCMAAKRANAYVAIGINERDKQYRARMYNSILYLSPRGQIIGTHRKICITIHERLFHQPGGGGNNLKAVFETEIGNLGGSICGEHKQLTLTYNWIIQGIQVHCSLWPGVTSLTSTTDLHTRALCSTAGVFGVLAATYIPEKDQPKDFYSNSTFNTPKAFRGGSGIVNPYGEYVTGPVYDQETIVYGDIDLSDIDKSRCSTNLTGLYSRWDLININVRQEPYEPVIAMGEPRDILPTSESDLLKSLDARVRRMEEKIDKLSKKKVNDSAD